MTDIRARLEEVRTMDNRKPEEFRYVFTHRAGFLTFSQPLSKEETIKAWVKANSDPSISKLEFLDDDGQWELV